MNVFPRRRGAPVFLSILSLSLVLGAQDPPDRSRPTAIDPELTVRTAPTGQIVVRIGFAVGTTLPFLGEVRLYSHMGFLEHTEVIRDSSQVIFRDVPVGEYSVELVVPGFAVTREQAVLWQPGMVARVFLNLQPVGAVNPANNAAGLPLLAPKARKETERGVAALRANDLKEAQTRFERALKLAPGHPLVNYLIGVLYLRLDDLERARTHMEKAATFSPNSAAAHAVLGEILYRLADDDGAIRALQRALVLKPDYWNVHFMIARAYYHERQYEKARGHAERAKELAGEQAPEIRLFLAQALAALGQREQAVNELQTFLSGHPDHPSSPAVRRQLTRMRQGEKDSAPPVPATGDTDIMALASRPALPSEPELPDPRWTPPHVDEMAPPVAGDVACSLPQVLTATGQRAVALVQNLQRFTATENIEVTELDAAGRTSHPQPQTVEYVVSIREVRPGTLSVEEDRRNKSSSDASPARLASSGLAALALIFHPYYFSDFEMRCEGLGQWRGEPVWQIYFRERPESSSRIRVYETRAGRFPVKLIGRAWIAANSYQVLRLETELAKPIKEIGLEREHLAVEYGPVDFVQRKVRLWLPSSAELYAQLRGHRYHDQRSFSDFLLFSVDVNQQIPHPPPL